MNNLYGNLSEVYEAMYQTFINYEEEYKFYSEKLLKYGCRSLIEIGCGTGHLADSFTRAGFEYYGLDLSDDMLSLAAKKYPQCRFLKGDMRNFELPEKSASCIITGRTLSYLLTNKDVYAALLSINRNLFDKGILCFDFIDANKFIPRIKNGERITHSAVFNNKKYRRESYWSLNFSQSWAFDWASVYYEEKEGGSIEKLGEDNSVIRAFCKDQIILFLELAGFAIKEIIERPSYAFDTFVMVAQKL